jgi:hypothetical protein
VNDLVTLIGAYVGGMVLAIAVAMGLRAGIAAGRRRINRARGADRPAWATGIWHCAACRSTNSPAATRCSTCRRPREELERPAVPRRPDWIPPRIEVPARAIVSLVHDPRAHEDPGAAHWQLVVAGQLAGSAATRVGALRLLRGIAGAETIALDLRGTGAADFRLAEVIERFKARNFPLDVDCPERSRS